jgi:hypothetical protein
MSLEPAFAPCTLAVLLLPWWRRREARPKIARARPAQRYPSVGPDALTHLSFAPTEVATPGAAATAPQPAERRVQGLPPGPYPAAGPAHLELLVHNCRGRARRPSLGLLTWGGRAWAPEGRVRWRQVTHRRASATAGLFVGGEPHSPLWRRRRRRWTPWRRCRCRRRRRRRLCHHCLCCGRVLRLHLRKALEPPPTDGLGHHLLLLIRTAELAPVVVEVRLDFETAPTGDAAATR